MEKRKITISNFNNNVVLGENGGLKVHTDSLKGAKLSSEPP